MLHGVSFTQTDVAGGNFAQVSLGQGLSHGDTHNRRHVRPELLCYIFRIPQQTETTLFYSHIFLKIFIYSLKVVWLCFSTAFLTTSLHVLYVNAPESGLRGASRESNFSH